MDKYNIYTLLTERMSIAGRNQMLIEITIHQLLYRGRGPGVVSWAGCFAHVFKRT